MKDPKDKATLEIDFDNDSDKKEIKIRLQCIENLLTNIVELLEGFYKENKKQKKHVNVD